MEQLMNSPHYQCTLKERWESAEFDVYVYYFHGKKEDNIGKIYVPDQTGVPLFWEFTDSKYEMIVYDIEHTNPEFMKLFEAAVA